MRRLVTVAVRSSRCTLPVAAQDKAADVMKQTREALGGKKLTELKALSLEGPIPARDGAAAGVRDDGADAAAAGQDAPQ